MVTEKRGSVRRWWDRVQSALAARELLLLSPMGKWIAGLVGSLLTGILGWIRGVEPTYLMVAVVVTGAAILSAWTNLARRPELIKTSRRPTVNPSRLPTATVDELRAPYVADRAFRMVDVPRDGQVVSRKVFERCMIDGPAVVVAKDSTLQGITFDSSNIPSEEVLDALIWRRPAGWMMGAIMLERCVIRDSVLSGIGLVMAPDDEAQLRAEFARSMSRRANDSAPTRPEQATPDSTQVPDTRETPTV